MAFKLVAGTSPVVVVKVVGPWNLEADCDRA